MCAQSRSTLLSTSDASPVDGRVAFVTGGARGLGRAIAERLRQAGARGMSFDRDEHEAPDGWLAQAGDVSQETELAASYARSMRRFGRLDIVVANAGLVPPWRETEAIDLAEWDEVFAVNVRGVIATIKHAVPLLHERGGAIVVMASINAHRAHPRQCLYTASKHAVLGIVRAAALDLGRHNIRVCAVGPGPVATEALLGRMQARAQAGGAPMQDAIRDASDTALGRMATERDVANTVLFLASDGAASITGVMLPVDAGLA